jgi:hypothetical protein
MKLPFAQGGEHRHLLLQCMYPLLVLVHLPSMTCYVRLAASNKPKGPLTQLGYRSEFASG